MLSVGLVLTCTDVTCVYLFIPNLFLCVELLPDGGSSHSGSVLSR